MFNQFFGEEGSKRVSKWAAFSLMFLSAFLLVKVLADVIRLPDVNKETYPQSTINVSGTGEAYAIPDIATFNFSVTETDKTVKGAQDKVNQKINDALAAIHAGGVADKDIQTTSYNVYPKYEYSNAVCPQSSSSAYYCPQGKQVLTGYEVNQTITVKVRQTDKAADLVTKVGAIGVQNISGLQFSVDDREQYVAQARAAAIIEAKAKAKVLAKQLGVHLGKIMYYSENGNYPVYAMDAKGGMGMASSNLAPVAQLPQGETKITSDISITYEIK